MFITLLKHEWRNSRSLVGLLCGIIAASGLLIGGSLRNIIWSSVNGNQPMVSAYTTVLAAAVIAILGSVFLAMYLLAYRFYQSRFTDQGYLMLTLPVTTHQQLLSSMVNTMIGVGLVGLTAICSVIVAIAASMSVFKDPPVTELWQHYGELWGGLCQHLGISDGAMLLFIPHLLIAFLADMLLFMLALTVGSQVNKHPVLNGAMVYIAVDVLVSEGCGLLGKLIHNPDLTAAVYCIVYGILAIVSYWIMYDMIDQKLNLT